LTRGGALLLGAGVTAAAVAFGSRPLGVVGVGLLVAASLARIWAGMVRSGVSVSFSAVPATAVEGDRVRLRVEAVRATAVPVGSMVANGVLGRLGAIECSLRGHGRRMTGDLYLGKLPRGRFALSDASIVLGDHLGLESVSMPVAEDGFAIVVHPRLADVGTLFSEAGRFGAHGRRLLLRRPSGFDLHSVREYTQGESLRRVHWPTTARTGQLMVKELEDSPRDSISVLLDCDPAGRVGEPPDSSFDAAVRAAGSILRHYAAKARKATLLTTGRAGVVQPVTSFEGDFRAALGHLSAAEADALFGLAPWLREEQGRSSRSGEIVVVTANLEPAALEALLAMSTRRLVSVVWVDAASYAGKPARAATAPLRLAAMGVPLAVVRQGEDLASALDFSAPAPAKELAHA
jgi:uncharacterized protein (DUF58 family)